MEDISAADMTSTEDREFFISLGERITALRKARNLTQAQLAEALGVSQQSVQAYEVGRRRMPVSSLPAVARVLDVSLEELFGEKIQTRGKRGPASRLEQQFEAVSQLPKTQQRFVTQMLDTVLAQSAQ
ncbi:helix-turn-helix domain-containing protein [Noviherbaspirillum sp. Root189]|uniref:helix-turn-helix domain-containing protein n=1 Tax=Noviherbaspirillum sp. Root189 TaxID=1736487 RepID=UPI001F22F85F|nr:helix-turn-helix transcriptional regulator [Noviherbaspirillum sp. Root189]